VLGVAVVVAAVLIRAKRDDLPVDPNLDLELAVDLAA
jgi:hypothetical protein